MRLLGWEGCIGQGSRSLNPRREARGQPEGQQRGSWWPYPQASFVSGQSTVTLPCVYSLGARPGLRTVGDLGQPHACFLTIQKAPQLLLSSIPSPKRGQPPSFRTFLQSSQVCLRLLPTSERCSSFIIEHLIIASSRGQAASQTSDAQPGAPRMSDTCST